MLDISSSLCCPAAAGNLSNRGPCTEIETGSKMAWLARMGLLKAKREVVVNIGCPLAVVHSNLVIVVVASSLHAERPDISYAQAGP